MDNQKTPGTVLNPAERMALYPLAWFKASVKKTIYLPIFLSHVFEYHWDAFRPLADRDPILPRVSRQIEESIWTR